MNESEKDRTNQPSVTYEFINTTYDSINTNSTTHLLQIAKSIEHSKTLLVKQWKLEKDRLFYSSKVPLDYTSNKECSSLESHQALLNSSKRREMSVWLETKNSIQSAKLKTQQKEKEERLKKESVADAVFDIRRAASKLEYLDWTKEKKLADDYNVIRSILHCQQNKESMQLKEQESMDATKYWSKSRRVREDVVFIQPKEWNNDQMEEL